jgi:hypothetical protein
MTERLMAASRAEKKRGKCSHYWIIDSPNGPTSVGRCKYCGAVKEFDNYLPYSSWAEEKAASRGRHRHRGPAKGEKTASS